MEKSAKLWCDDCQKHNNFSVNYIKNNKKTTRLRILHKPKRWYFKTIVDDYKFNNIKQNADILGKILADSLEPTRLQPTNRM